ncbi:Nitrogen assimilation regulatory protein [Roseivivax jejudonensis]|uniref:Nitrogen assimilation regulatory protein n=1 Tax=Roseivivax jejudonensis TaxID=1529041 RepID=A0A1X6Y3X3_9RHOB|nr:phosphoenolpyruvate hydrolase family protein [Roseivivax jejudonensis]SLN10130.1 Nitrogen assimilation regulatory protein [Roseivivax jejudonensis]
MPQDTSEGLLIGAAVGSGIAAQTAEVGGADLLLAVNAARMRNMGAPSIASMLPCHAATAMTDAFAAREILPRVSVPVLLGINCWDPDFTPESAVDRVAEQGFAGAVNFPNTTLMPRAMRQILDRAGRGFRREIEALARVQSAGYRALYYCGAREHAQAAAEAGIDMILLNFGWNAGGSLGHAQRASLEEVGLIARDYAALVRRIHPGAQILLEGGPVVSAEDLGHVARVATLDGYVGGSTLDRMPYEESVTNRIAGYRQAGRRQDALTERQEALLRWGRRHGFAGRSGPVLACLEHLEALSGTRRAIAVTQEPGTPFAPTLSALDGGRRDAPHIDGRDDPGPRVSRRLFGHDDADGYESGLLTSPGNETIVLRDMHRTLPSLQLRLARSLAHGALVTSRRRRRMRITARVIFLFERAADEPLFPDDLHPDLVGLLSGWAVRMPPVRRRIDDLPDIMAARAADAGLGSADLPQLSPGALHRLRRHPWPGNEAELDRVIGGLVARSASEDVSGTEIAALLDANTADQAQPETATDLEKRQIVEALWRNDFHRGRTAEALHISRKTLYNRMARLGLND